MLQPDGVTVNPFGEIVGCLDAVTEQLKPVILVNNVVSEAVPTDEPMVQITQIEQGADTFPVPMAYTAVAEIGGRPNALLVIRGVFSNVVPFGGAGRRLE